MPRGKPKTTHQIICVVCGREVESDRISKKYCGKTCSNKAEHQRVKANPEVYAKVLSRAAARQARVRSSPDTRERWSDIQRRSHLKHWAKRRAAQRDYYLRRKAELVSLRIVAGMTQLERATDA